MDFRNINSADTNGVENDAIINSENNEEKPEPVDSKVDVEIELGGYSARVIVYPPKDGGADVTAEMLIKALNDAGVTYGIDSAVLSYIQITKKYNEWITAAKCLPAQNGENGTVEYLFSKEAQGQLHEDARGYVDFKNLGIVRNITKGTVIANITKETAGTAGINVRNEPINPKAGMPPKITYAENITTSDDGLTIYATSDGNLTFSGGRFSVQETLKMDGDIDVSTGNIDFIGDVVIRGDVREGFKVSAGKTITIYGGVFGAQIVADGKIQIRNGSIGSTITSGSSVEMDFAENTSINCCELLKSRSLYFCDVFCKGEISVTAGNGSIVGGRVISTKNLSANNIGSKNYTPTTVIIGDNAIMLEEKEKILAEIAQLTLDEEKCAKIIEFLNQKQDNLGKLTKEKVDYLNSALKTVLRARHEKNRLSKRVEEIDIYLQTKQNLYVTCKKELNPGSKIVINDSVFNVNMLYQYCKVGLGENGIEVRTL